MQYADDKKEEYTVDSNKSSLFAFASWLENTMGFTHEMYSIDTIDKQLDAAKMTYEEFLFSQLSMLKLARYHALQDKGYDELYPLIKEWYSRFQEDKSLFSRKSEYDEMEDWIAENVG